MQLSNKFLIFSGYAFKEFNTDKRGVPVIKIGNITANGMLDVEDIQYSTQKPNNKFYAQKGDFFIALSGATTGKSTIYSLEDNRYLVNQRVGIIRPINKDDKTKYFSKYYLQYISKIVLQKAHGTAQPNISPKDLAKFPFPNIEDNEQIKIGNLLYNLEQAIKVKQEQLKALDELIQSRFTEMFENNSYEVKPIREIVANNIQTTKKVFKKEDTIQYIDISSIDNLQHNITGTTPYIVADAPSRAQQYIQYNDILVSTVRPNLQNIAINKYQDTNLIASSGFCVLRPEKCAPEYLLYNVLSNEFTTKMISLTTGASYPAVRDNDVLNYTIPVPPLPLQNQFAEFVQQVEKAKEIVKIQIKDLQELLALKMDEYFK